MTRSAVERAPNLIVAGVMRAGTTSVYNALARSEAVFAPVMKEPSFLAFTKSEPSFRGPGDSRFFRTVPRSMQAYEKLYDNTLGKPCRLDASAMYSYLPGFRDGYLSLRSNPHCLVILRDPVGRAYSAYQYQKMLGWERLSFEDALAQEPVRIRDGWAPMWHYRRASEYSSQVAYLREFIPADRLHFLTLDALQGSIAAALNPILQENFAFSLACNVVDHDPHRNRSGASRYPRMSRALARRFLPVSVKQRLPTGALRLLNALSSTVQTWQDRQRSPAEHLDPRSARRLRSTFSQDVSLTENLTGLTLDHWR